MAINSLQAMPALFFNTDWLSQNECTPSSPDLTEAKAGGYTEHLQNTLATIEPTEDQWDTGKETAVLDKSDSSHFMHKSTE